MRRARNTAERSVFAAVAPWAVVASLPFAPEIVLPTVRYFQDVYPQVTGEYCLRCSFNLTFPHEGDAGSGWTSPYHFGINLGPAVLMCENYRSGLLWRPNRACPYVPRRDCGGRDLRMVGYDGDGDWLYARSKR